MEDARADDRHRARALRREHARVHPAGGAAHVRAADAAAAAHRSSRAATRWSSCAATTTAATSPRCARTSASTSRCSSASTAAPTRCSSIGFKPDIIIGDFDSVSEQGPALRRRAGAPRASRRSRARVARTSLEWGVDYHEFVAEGTSEDVAMLLAYESRVAADRRRRAPTPPWSSSSTRAARAWRRRSSPACASGPMLVDAKGVSRLYEGRVRRRDIVAARRRRAVAMVVVGIVAEPIHVFLRGLWVTLKDLFDELMINFRFHLVSLIAIFLALALGVVDRRRRHRPRRRRHAQQPARQRRGEVRPHPERERRAQRPRTASSRQAIVGDCSPRGERARSSATTSVSSRCAASTATASTTSVTAAQQADATVTGTLWLEDKWALDRRRRR